MNTLLFLTWCLLVGCLDVGLKLANRCLVWFSKDRLVKLPSNSSISFDLVYNEYYNIICNSGSLNIQLVFLVIILNC